MRDLGQTSHLESLLVIKTGSNYNIEIEYNPKQFYYFSRHYC